MASPLELQVLQLQCVLEAKDREIQQLRARMGQLFDQQDLVDQLQTQLAQARAQAATHSPAQAAAPTPATTVAAAAAAAAAVQQPGVAQTSRAVPSVRVEQCKSLSHSAVQLLTRLQVELQQLGCELPSVGPAAAATGSTQQQGGRSPGQQQEGQQGGQQQGQGQGQQQGRQQQAQQGVQEQGQQGQEQGQAQQQGQGQAEGGSHPKGVSPEALVCLQRLNSLVGIQCGVEGKVCWVSLGALLQAGPTAYLTQLALSAAGLPLPPPPSTPSHANQARQPGRPAANLVPGCNMCLTVEPSPPLTNRCGGSGSSRPMLRLPFRHVLVAFMLQLLQDVWTLYGEPMAVQALTTAAGTPSLVMGSGLGAMDVGSWRSWKYSLSPKGASQTNASLQPSDLPTLQYLESVLGLNALWEDGADPPDVAWFITQQLQVAQRTNQDVVLWSDPQSGPGQPAVVAGSGKGDVQGGRGFQQHGPVQAAQGFNMYARMATLAANDA